MKYRASCHCGAVAFDVEGDIDSAMACNCSLCQRKGSLVWFVRRSLDVMPAHRAGGRLSAAV